jgi:hypothetical protein
MPRPNGNEAENTLRKRLRLVAERYPQAEIARRTNESTANVSRYLRSNRIPATFTAAVVSGLGVNPAWLLTGEGTPWLADVSAAQGDMARNLLELVQSMAAVSRVKLGALAGRSDAKALRELDDALRGFERTRERLNTQTSQVFGELLDGFEAELVARNETAASHSMKSVEQLSRLCHDPGLQMRKLRLEARFHSEFGDLPTALELNRSVFYRGLVRGRDMQREDLLDALRLVLGLESVGRFREALGFVRALQAVVDAAGHDWPEVPRLAALEGRMLASLRDLPGAVAALQAANARGVDVRLALHIAYLHMGTIGFDEFMKRAPQDEMRADWAVRYALWLAEPEALRAAVAAYERSREGVTTTARFEPECARLLLAAMKGERDVLHRFDQALDRATFIVQDRPPWDVAIPVWRCQLSMATGDNRTARKDLERADKALLATSPDVVIPIQMEAGHYRNALALTKASDAIYLRARAFMKNELARGYRFLEPVAREHGG